MTLHIDIDDEPVRVASKFEVCPRCEGRGTHTNPAIDGNGLTGNELAEIVHDDPEFLEDYRSGVYDIACQECGGQRVVEVPDLDRMTERQIAAWNEQERELYEMHAEQAAELRMGA